MRTKALFVAAALAVATVATSVAQVTYSVNAVGYVKAPTVPAGNWAMMCNPLDAGDNTVANVMPNAAVGTSVYVYRNGAYEAVNSFIGVWLDPAQEIPPGQGFFIRNDTADIDLTFVGEVPQGTDSNVVLPADSFSLVGSIVPQAGLLQTDLAYPAQAGDGVYQWDVGTQGYKDPFAFVGVWVPSEPQLNVGEAVWILPAAGTGPRDWVRDFSVNN